MEIIHRNTDYVVRAMARLAADGEVMSVAALAGHISVPVDFLRKTMQKVNRAGLVESVRGPFGGYKLKRDPENITFLEIIETVQGPLRMNACFTDPGICKKSGMCAMQDMLGDVEERFRCYLEDITLLDIIRRLDESGR